MRCWAQLPWHCPHGRLGIQANASPCGTTLFPAVALPIRYWEVLHPGVNRFDVDREGKNNELRPGFVDARWSDALHGCRSKYCPISRNFLYRDSTKSFTGVAESSAS